VKKLLPVVWFVLIVISVAIAWSEANGLHVVVSSVLPMIVSSHVAPIVAWVHVGFLCLMTFVAGVFSVLFVSSLRKKPGGSNAD
jgi:hypothetical protein